jgi:hypothetical protein
LLTDRSLPDAREITAIKISEALGDLPPATMHAAELAMDALSAVLEKLQKGRL